MEQRLRSSSRHRLRQLVVAVAGVVASMGCLATVAEAALILRPHDGLDAGGCVAEDRDVCGGADADSQQLPDQRAERQVLRLLDPGRVMQHCGSMDGQVASSTTPGTGFVASAVFSAAELADLELTGWLVFEPIGKLPPPFPSGLLRPPRV